jgi:hypothetical protein
MNLDQTHQILAILYSLWRKNETNEDLEREARIWHWAFQHDPYEVVEYGVQLWIKGGNAFKPQPSQIRHILASRSISIIPEEEWSTVLAALNRHNHGLDKDAITIDPENDRAVFQPPPTFHYLTQRTIDMICERFMRTEPEMEVRKAFIHTLKNLIDIEIERLAYGERRLSIDLIQHPELAS